MNIVAWHHHSDCFRVLKLCSSLILYLEKCHPYPSPEVIIPSIPHYHIPTEILLEIVPFEVTRKESCKPYTALTPQERQDEDGRVSENALIVHTLASLSSVSRRLHRITEPLLYSSFILNFASPTAAKSVLNFLRTITEDPDLADHINYIETTADDVDLSRFLNGDNHLGFGETCRILATGAISKAAGRTYGFPERTPSIPYPLLRRDVREDHRLWPDLVLWIESLSIFPQQALLALVVHLAPNVAHIALTSIEHSSTPSFWAYCGFHIAYFSDSWPFHRFQRLSSLSMRIIEVREVDGLWRARMEWYPDFAPVLT